METIVISNNNRSFEKKESKENFNPFGVNYFDPLTGWPPQIWKKFDVDRVKRHFDQMAGIGVNVVRVFLSQTSFLPGFLKIDEHGFDKLDKMLTIGKEKEIRFFLTGPETIEGVCDWAKEDFFADEKSLENQEYFWDYFTKRYKDDPTIFAFDFLNEPFIKWKSGPLHKKWNRWVREKYKRITVLKNRWKDVGKDERWGNIQIPKDEDNLNDPRLYDFQLFRENIGCEWVRRMSRIVKSVDGHRLVSYGNLQNSFPVPCDHTPSWYSGMNVKKIAKWLDFHSPHFYPLNENFTDPLISKEEIKKGLKYLLLCLESFPSTKPVVLSEFGWYGGGKVIGWKGKPFPFKTEEDEALYNKIVILTTTGYCSGWLSWAAYDTPDSMDQTRYGGMFTSSEKTKRWGRVFAILSQNTKERKSLRTVVENRGTGNYQEILTSSEKAIEFLKKRFNQQNQKLKIVEKVYQK